MTNATNRSGNTGTSLEQTRVDNEAWDVIRPRQDRLKQVVAVRHERTASHHLSSRMPRYSPIVVIELILLLVASIDACDILRGLQCPRVPESENPLEAYCQTVKEHLNCWKQAISTCEGVLRQASELGIKFTEQNYEKTCRKIIYLEKFFPSSTTSTVCIVSPRERCNIDKATSNQRANLTEWCLLAKNSVSCLEDVRGSCGVSFFQPFNETLISLKQDQFRSCVMATAVTPSVSLKKLNIEVRYYSGQAALGSCLLSLIVTVIGSLFTFHIPPL